MEIAESIDKSTFGHKGFKFTINMRPDLLYLYAVHGFNKKTNKDFLPKILFDQNLTFEQIRDAVISIMDNGMFVGKVETHGQYNVCVDVQTQAKE